MGPMDLLLGEVFEIVDGFWLDPEVLRAMRRLQSLATSYSSIA